MPGRSYTNGSGYRYGFNGKEKDSETTGTSTYDYGFRIYSPGLGRFLSIDPLSKSFPWNSPYSYAEGDPINYIDLDGLEKPAQTAQSTFPATKPVISPQLSNYLKAEALRSQVVDQIFKIITPQISGYLDAPGGVGYPETVKATISQHLLISGTDIKNLQLAIIIPNKDGDGVRGLVTTTYEGLDELGITGKIQDVYADKLNKVVTKTAAGFIQLSKLGKNKDSKYTLKLFGKTLSFLSKAIKVADLVNEVVDAPESLNKGDIPVVGLIIQSNPSQNSEINMQNRTLSALRSLAPPEDPKILPNPIPPTYQDNTALPKPIIQPPINQ